MRETALFLALVASAMSACGKAPSVDAAADSGGKPAACKKTDDCKDLNTSFFQYAACCSPHVACGYEISYEDEFLEVYPQARDLLLNLASDDPAGKCVPDSYVFPVRPGTYDHRVEVEGPEEGDVLVAAQCESRGFLVFTLPGCCMPDNRCGISTDEIGPTFEVLLDGESAPFSKPECLTAAALNMQLKASPLDAFARIPATSGDACDYASLAQAQPRYRQPAKR